MLAGKWISKMFEPEPIQEIVIDYQKLSYEFTCDMHYENFGKIIQSYFSNFCIDVNYTYKADGKVFLL